MKDSLHGLRVDACYVNNQLLPSGISDYAEAYENSVMDYCQSKIRRAICDGDSYTVVDRMTQACATELRNAGFKVKPVDLDGEQICILYGWKNFYKPID